MSTNHGTQNATAFQALQPRDIAVTDADREALWLRLLDSCKGGPQWEYARACEDADAQAIARARAEGAASERAACELALALVERPKKFRADPIRRDTFDDTVAACMDAIRARGEGGKA